MGRPSDSWPPDVCRAAVACNLTPVPPLPETNPEGGEIVRDDDGEPTGVFIGARCHPRKQRDPARHHSLTRPYKVAHAHRAPSQTTPSGWWRTTCRPCRRRSSTQHFSWRSPNATGWRMGAEHGPWARPCRRRRDTDGQPLRLRLTQRGRTRLGLTGVHDAGVTATIFDLYKRYATGGSARVDLLGAGRQRHGVGLTLATVAAAPARPPRRTIDAGNYPLRNYAYLSCANGVYVCPEVAPIVIDYGGRLTVRAVKLYMDGALGSWGAAMIEPYSGEPAQRRAAGRRTPH